MSPESLSAWASVASAVFTLGLLAVAIIALSPAKKTWAASKAAADAAAEANRQAERDSREQSRPYVSAQIVPGLAGVATWDLKITNHGKTAARELTMDYDHWPTTDDEKAGWPHSWDNVSRSIHTMFTTPHTLAPGASLRVIWLLELGKNEDPKTSDPVKGLNKFGEVTLQYRSDDPKAPAYTDSYTIHGIKSGLWPVPEDGPKLRTFSRMTYGEKRRDRLMRLLIQRVGELGR